MNSVTINSVTTNNGNYAPSGRYGRRHRYFVRNLLVLLWLCGNSHVGFAIEYESPQAIRTTVDNFLSDRLQNSKLQDFEVHVDRLDPRLRLAHCSAALEPFLPSTTQLMGRITVGIRCPEGKSWTVYVPAQIVVFENVLTAARPLLRGQRIEANDVMVVRQRANRRSRAYFHEPAQIIGMVAKRSIAMGKAFSLQLIQPPRLVQRGEDVTLVAETNALTVRMKGKALADGAEGDVIRVKNSTSNRVVEGVVTRPGIVKVKM
jgi:flagella basal body P-ring formation protein FlgA